MVQVGHYEQSVWLELLLLIGILFELSYKRKLVVKKSTPFDRDQNEHRDISTKV
jgi:hypothetical protein